MKNPPGASVSRTTHTRRPPPRRSPGADEGPPSGTPLEDLAKRIRSICPSRDGVDAGELGGGFDLDRADGRPEARAGQVDRSEDDRLIAEVMHVQHQLSDPGMRREWLGTTHHRPLEPAQRPAPLEARRG